VSLGELNTVVFKTTILKKMLFVYVLLAHAAFAATTYALNSIRS
jgi:hypothetical protein